MSDTISRLFHQRRMVLRSHKKEKYVYDRIKMFIYFKSVSRGLFLRTYDVNTVIVVGRHDPSRLRPSVTSEHLHIYGRF